MQDHRGQEFDTILNPYYNQAPQGLLNESGWYNPYTTAIAPNLNAALGSYISPIVSSLILNYRHDKLAITPSLKFQTGGFYGSPLDTNGLDPRACTLNSAATGITKRVAEHESAAVQLPARPRAGLGQFGFLYIPDPQTDLTSITAATELDRRKSSGLVRREPAGQADDSRSLPLPRLLRRIG